MKTPSKKQSGPAWLANLETTSTGTSPKHTTSWAGSGAETTRSRPSPTSESAPVHQVDSHRRQWLTRTSFKDGDLVAGARISQWNVVRLRKLAKYFQLTRNDAELGRFDRLDRAIDAFEHASHGAI